MRTSLSCNGWRGAFHMPIRPREMDFADWSIVYVLKCLWEPIAPRNEGTIAVADARSEEHTSELQSLMRISYAVFCLKKKKKNKVNDRHVYIHQSQTGVSPRQSTTNNS